MSAADRIESDASASSSPRTGALAARRGHHLRVVLAAGLLLIMWTGALACATPQPQRQPADFASRFERVRTITLVPPKVAVYRMSAGDTEEEVQGWSDEAYAHVIDAVKSEVAELGREFVPYAGEELAHRMIIRTGGAERASADGHSAAEDSWLLFEAANMAIMRHAYDPWNTFPEKVKNFDYTLGPEARSLIGDTKADAFMLIIASDHIPTRERAALVAVGLAAGAMTMSYAGPGATPAKLTLALVESATGDILWFNTLSLPFTDLRDEATDQALIDTVMKGLPQ
jgi:hypothetical protein